MLTPKSEELLSKNFSLSTGYMVCHVNKSEYEVRGRDGVAYSVDLDNKSCSCLEFDMLLIPCTHAVAAAVHSRKRVDSLVSQQFRRSTWGMAYSMSINPVSEYETVLSESDTLGVMHLAPPNTRRPPGRPKKTRILSRGEFKVLFLIFLVHV